MRLKSQDLMVAVQLCTLENDVRMQELRTSLHLGGYMRLTDEIKQTVLGLLLFAIFTYKV